MMPNAESLSRILVGVHSRDDDDAVRAGAMIAQRTGAKLDLLHVLTAPGLLQSALDPDGTDEALARTMVEAREQQHEHLGALLGEIWPGGPPLEEMLHLLPGKPGKALSEFATEHHVDLCIVGPHHRAGLFDFHNTALTLMRGASYAVWDQMVPYRPIERILFATDLSEEALRPLPQVMRLAGALGARVTALHCFMPPEFAYDSATEVELAGPTYVVDALRARERDAFMRKMEEADWGGVRHEHLFGEGDPGRAILDLADQVQLIALGSHGRTGLARVFLGNLAYAVLEKAEVPVLTYPLTGESPSST